ncbi:hypothetical protein H0G86_005929 [Trichoderma simmonsii]|uniref:Uncharacterized protein n=1 Tax=Trichoderma simmonsii TaxID=1491479 RepID=A0A8G0LFK1_9HYPO|nr:hypothetical protein H0G86_005929 [Trichoderma simmonsii]
MFELGQTEDCARALTNTPLTKYEVHSTHAAKQAVYDELPLVALHLAHLQLLCYRFEYEYLLASLRLSRLTVSLKSAERGPHWCLTCGRNNRSTGTEYSYLRRQIAMCAKQGQVTWPAACLLTCGN